MDPATHLWGQVETLRSIFQELDRGKTNELSIEACDFFPEKKHLLWVGKTSEEKSGHIRENKKTPPPPKKKREI